jgi:serralysin
MELRTQGRHRPIGPPGAVESLETRRLHCANDGCPDPVPGPNLADPVVGSTHKLHSTPSLKSALTAIPALNSDPGAVATVYLDFHGEPAQAWGGQTVPATPAYDIDDDPTTFNAQELSNITQIWSRVSEAYSPFNVNVTTVDPGNWNYTGQGAALPQIRVVIGGDGSWTGQVEGGIAYVGSYNNSGVPNTAYVFSDNLATGDPQYTADDAAHEAGHGFGLVHQSVYNGTTKTAEYNPGNGTTAPFMGNPLSPNIRATWWDGPSSNGYNQIQDDVQILSNPSTDPGYRTLTVGQSTSTATSLSFSSGNFSTSSIIETTSQNDYYAFTTSSTATDTFNVNVAQYGAMLHARLEIHDSADNVVATAASASTLGQSITATLSPGTYYVVVKSYGQYGDIGQYTLSGSVSGTVALQPTATILGSESTSVGALYTLNLSAINETSTAPGWTINWGDGSAMQTVTGNPASVTHQFAAAGNYSISATLNDSSGDFDSNGLVVAVSGAPQPQPLTPDATFGSLAIRGRRVKVGRFTGKGSQKLYMFTLGHAELTNIRIVSARPGLTMQIVDANGNVLLSRTGKTTINSTMTLGAGTYYVELTSSSIRPAAFSLVTTTRPTVKSNQLRKSRFI